MHISSNGINIAKFPDNQREVELQNQSFSFSTPTQGDSKSQRVGKPVSYGVEYNPQDINSPSDTSSSYMKSDPSVGLDFSVGLSSGQLGPGFVGPQPYNGANAFPLSNTGFH